MKTKSRTGQALFYKDYVIQPLQNPYYGPNVCPPPPNSYVETLAPNVMIFEGGR